MGASPHGEGTFRCCCRACSPRAVKVSSTSHPPPSPHAHSAQTTPPTPARQKATPPAPCANSDAPKTNALPQITARELHLRHPRKRPDDDEAGVFRQLRQLRQGNKAATPAVARTQIRLLQPHQIQGNPEQTVRRKNPQLARIGKLHHRITPHLRRRRANLAAISGKRTFHLLQISVCRGALADGIAHLLSRRYIRRPTLLRRLIAAVKQHIHHQHIRRIHRAQMRIKKIVEHQRQRQLRQQLTVGTITLAQIHHRGGCTGSLIHSG